MAGGGGMAAKIDQRREASLRGRGTSASRPASQPVPWRNFVVLLWLSGIAFGLGLVLVVYGRVAAGHLPAPSHDTECPRPDVLCQQGPFQRTYLVGKASACLLGSAVWEPLEAFRRHAPASWAPHSDSGIGGEADLHNVVRHVQRATMLAAGVPSGAALFDSASCSALYASLSEQTRISRVSVRFHELQNCGMRALQRVAPPQTPAMVWGVLHAIVDRVSSEFAIRTPFHRDLLCGVIDDPITWERARNSLRGIDAWSTPSSEVSCSFQTWRDCQNATDSERALALSLRAEAAARAQDTAVQSLMQLLEDRTGDAGIKEMLSLTINPIAATASHIQPVRDYLLAGYSLPEIAHRLLDKSLLLDGQVQMEILGADGAVYHPPVPGRLSSSECELQGVCSATVRTKIDDIYREVLLRPADDGAVKAYMCRLQADGDVAWLRRVLMDSVEFSDTCMGGMSCASALHTVESIYLEVLARPADPEGKMHYARLLALGDLSAGELVHILEQSQEFLTGPSLVARKAVRCLLNVRKYFFECGGNEAAIWGGHQGDVPSQNFSDPYWNGRWCDRRGCDDAGVEACGVWPRSVYRLLLATLWGNVPEHWILRREGDDVLSGRGGDSNGRVVGIDDGKLGRFATALGMISDLYVEMLGRFPDIGALVGRVPRLAHEIFGRRADGGEKAFLNELRKELLDSGERAQKVILVAGEERQRHWREKAQVLAQLYLTHGLEMPADVAACFQQGQLLTPARDGSCMSVGGVVKRLQEEWNRESPLLGDVGKVQSRPDQGYGPGRQPDGDGACLTPVALYVHQRPHYFRQVVSALSQVEGISDVCVLIVSLDSVDQGMIEIALGIDFAPVKMLFHPVRADLVELQPVVAIKEHWIWLQDEIWTRMSATRRRQGHVALLEEDHIVTPDYLKVLTELISLRERECKGCWGVTVRWACMHDNDQDHTKLCRSHSVINTGIAFDRSTYEAIKSSDFASFGDGWDWSLFHLAQTGQMPDMMLGPAVSRISNIGKLGATVTEGGDAHLQKQLQYNNVGDKGLAVSASSLWIHTEEARQYTPPCWEPLFVGGVGFIA